MAVSIDRWAPGTPKPQSRRRAPAFSGTDAGRDNRAVHTGNLRADRSYRRPAPHWTPAQDSPHGPDRSRDWGRSHSSQASQSSQLLGAPRFNASRALWMWLACGLVLTLTCPPIAAAQTLFGALPLWLVGLPAASLALVAMGNARR